MAARKKKPETLQPSSSPVQPGERGPNALWISMRQAGVVVNEDTALTLAAVWACVRVIAETIASLPWQVYRAMPDGGRQRVSTHPADWLIGTQANPEMPAFQFTETLLAHALTFGNGFAEIERNPAGRPVWLWPLTPCRVEPMRADDGRIVYRISNPSREPTYLEAEDVFHLRGLGYDGLVGYSVVRLASRAIGQGIALEEFGSSFFGNDATPGGFLKHPGRLSDQARQNLQKSWNQKHQGPYRRRSVAILEEGLDWVQTGLPPEDALFITSQQFSVNTICRWYRVPPHKVAELARSTYSNIESQNIDFVTDTLLPWVRRLESEANIKLFGRVQQGTVYSRINLNGLLRGDAPARASFYTQMIDRGVFSINDVLELEDRNPIGPDGDKRFVPLNMQLLEKAGEEEPEPEPAPSPVMGESGAGDDSESDADQAADEEGADSAESGSDSSLAAFLPILTDTCARLLRRERNESARALRRDNPAVPLARFLDEHSLYTTDAFRPLVQAHMLASRQRVDVQRITERLAEAHLADLRRRLQSADEATCQHWEADAPHLAARLHMELRRLINGRTEANACQT